MGPRQLRERVAAALALPRITSGSGAEGDPQLLPRDRNALPIVAAARRSLPALRLFPLALGSAWQGTHRRVPLRLLAFIVMVAIPTIATGIYEFTIAADQYVAEFRFGLRSAAPIAMAPAALWFASGGSSPANMDAAAIVQYIESRAIVDDLGRRLDLRRVFSRPNADWIARLHLPVSIEDLVRYWRGQVDAFNDTADGTIIVRVRAFTPQDALTLAQAIERASENLANELSARARHDALDRAEAAAARAQARLKVALARLRDFRDAHRLIDPHEAATARTSLANRVRAELVHARAERQTLRAYMHANAPTLRVLRARIAALEAQWHDIASGVTANGVGGQFALPRQMGSYDALEVDKTFAETAYKHALAALDHARSDADREQVYVASYVPPGLPEEALYPRRWRTLGVVALVAFAIWAIGCLVVQSVRDHL